MLCAIDIGNSNIVLGLFDQDELKAQWRIATHHQRTADEYAALLNDLLRGRGYDLRSVSGMIYSSVVPPLTAVIEELANRLLRIEPVEVTHRLKSGLTLRIDNPAELGADRLVNAAAAYARFGGPVIIVDFGTATTICAVTARGEYLGGSIAPGVWTAAEALFQRAAKLPRIDLVRPDRVIGTNTVAGMQAGILIGFAGLTGTLITRTRTEMAVIEPGTRARVIATGGLAALIAPECPEIQEVCPTLTLDGLKLLYTLNRPAQG
ncbi:MAG TPA: type III pantothenate kinase [Nitrospiria bacterium]|nr:type III pantothenate kinase [Nitrospiria bacterium]